MPRGDRTGPAGMGPRSGRGAGYCSGYPAPGFANPMPGRFFGRGRGYWGAYPADAWGYPPGPWGYPGYYEGPTEKEMLEEQVTFMKEQLKAMESRLEEIGDSDDE